MTRVTCLIVAASFTLGVGSAGPAVARPSPSQKCAAAKQGAVGKKSACKLGCAAKATLKGLALNDPTITTCLATCDTKFSTAFTKAEAKGGCNTAVCDATTIGGQVDALVTNAVTELPADTTCVQPFRPEVGDIIGGLSVGLDPSGNVNVPASCGGSTPICCSGGNPVSPCGPLQFDFVQRAGDPPASLDPTADPNVFTYNVPVRLKTVTDIPVTVPIAGACGVQIDTNPGPNPQIRIFGTVAFSADRLRMGPLTFQALTDLTSDDVALTGGPACQLVNFGLSSFLATVTELIQSTIFGASNNLCRVCCSNAVVQCGP